MGMVWKVIGVTLEDAEAGTGTWEPFAVGHDDDVGVIILCKGMFEEEGERSSTKPENENWAGRETTP